jgi:hypothetical protein
MFRIKDGTFYLHKQGDEYIEFLISNMDKSTAVKYYGFIGHAGYWIIMKWDTTTDIFLYAVGQVITTYTPNWDAAGLYIGTLVFLRADLLF